MKKIIDLNELNLPEKQRGFLQFFLTRISATDIVERIILFGSCAKGNLHRYSDIDIFIVTNREPTINDEIFLMADCPPDYTNEYYLQADIIIKPIENYEKHKNEMGMVQKYVELEGVDLTGLLSKRAG
ncbi:MAG: nucleotidyltransferase domain-containing protein [Clostridiales bacterium]|nr:nucleotidyltransferase domain-containing protein [Clostridiales bacterium]